MSSWLDDDLYDYDDPWDEWRLSAREKARYAAQKHMLGEHEDRAWAEEDEHRYLAALLYAGEEPEDSAGDAHKDWQLRAAHVLMHKYRRDWWYKTTETDGRVHPSPEYRQKAQMCRAAVQINELNKFYTWLCNQRREPWTSRIVPK